MATATSPTSVTMATAASSTPVAVATAASSTPVTVGTAASSTPVTVATAVSSTPVAMATAASLPAISSQQLLRKAAMAQGASFFSARKEAIQSAVRKNRFQRVARKIQAANAFCGQPADLKYVWKGTESAVTNVNVRDESPGHEMSEKTLLRLPKVKGHNQPTPAEIQIYRDTSYQCCDVLGDKTCSKCIRYNYRKQHVRGWGAKFRFAEHSIRIKHLLPELTVSEIRERLDCEEFSVSNFIEREKQKRAKLLEKTLFLKPSAQANRPYLKQLPTNDAIGQRRSLSLPGNFMIDRRANDSVEQVVLNIINKQKLKKGLELSKSQPDKLDKNEKALDVIDDKKEMGMTSAPPTAAKETGLEGCGPFRRPRPRSSLQTMYEPIRGHYPAHVIPNVDPPLVDVHCAVDARFYAGKGK